MSEAWEPLSQCKHLSSQPSISLKPRTQEHSKLPERGTLLTQPAGEKLPCRYQGYDVPKPLPDSLEHIGNRSQAKKSDLALSAMVATQVRPQETSDNSQENAGWGPEHSSPQICPCVAHTDHQGELWRIPVASHRTSTHLEHAALFPAI